MDDKLVTLAIRTYQRAQMIKSVLDEQGIDTVIHNLNLEHPEMAIGVRVRIKESDLPRALKIVEEMESAWEEQTTEKNTSMDHILLPIDFADFNERTIEFGFHFAKILSAEIIFLNVYYNPAFTISSNNEMSTYSIIDSELLRRTANAAVGDSENLSNRINQKIESGELPKAKFSFITREGIPEEEILDFCKKQKPALVVMGTHGKKISNELIGSVTAEVMEACSSPIFAVPENTAVSSPADIKRIAFLTSFDQKDLIAIDRAITLFSTENTELFFIHASEKKEAWDEVLLGGIKNYFANHYPALTINYALIGAVRSPEILDNFLMDEKIDILAFNTRRRNILSRLFRPGLAYNMLMHSDTPLYITHL